jgi:hypothetical protein
MNADTLHDEEMLMFGEEESNSRMWTGATDENGLPSGWGFVIGTNMTVWSHFVDGLPHYIPNETVNPQVNEEVSYLGEELWFKGEIRMGQPIVGEVKTNDNYHFNGSFHANGRPQRGTMYYYTASGEPNGFWEGSFSLSGDRSGQGKMTYRDGTSVLGIWNEDEITDGNIEIICGQTGETTRYRLVNRYIQEKMPSAFVSHSVRELWAR